MSPNDVVQVARRLAAGREEAFLARRLVKLDEAVPLAEVTEAAGRAARPRGAGDILAQTRWIGPRADAGALMAELGSQGLLRAFHGDARAV